MMSFFIFIVDIFYFLNYTQRYQYNEQQGVDGRQPADKNLLELRLCIRYQEAGQEKRNVDRDEYGNGSPPGILSLIHI